MSSVVVVKNTYKVDTLYQWDINQVLTIYGLSLASIPEIHFTNDVMDKAIVRQATMDNDGVISVDIPNSLLQKPYKITAYVCIYEGETFQSLYKIVIPVKARNKPSDYTISDNDGEIYSFKALENLVINTVKNVNAKCDETIASVNDGYAKSIASVNETVVKAISDINAVTNESTERLEGISINLEEEIADINETASEAFAMTKTLDEKMIDIIGYDKINLMPYPHYESTKTENGLTFTDNGDGTITVNGTSTGVCIFNFRERTEKETALIVEPGTYSIIGCPSVDETPTDYNIYVGSVADDNSVTNIGFETGNGLTFTCTEETKLAVQLRIGTGYVANNVVFNPMIVKGSDIPDIYEPCRDTIENRIINLENTLGYTVKNILPYPYYETTHTDNGIIWTDNGDGTLTANGTATDRSQFVIISSGQIRKILEVGKTYYFRGCPNGGGSSTYRIIFVTCKRVNGTLTTVETIGINDVNGTVFTITKPYEFLMVYIDIFKGTNVNNLIFKPMITKGNTAKPYEPYAKSVEERLGGCWIEFKDADGNPTDEPYIHWFAEVEEVSENGIDT